MKIWSFKGLKIFNGKNRMAKFNILHKGNAFRKISNIPWNFENDKFIRKESLNFPFYLELLGQTKEVPNSPGNNETRFNTIESSTNTNMIIFNNTKKGYKKSINQIMKK